MQIKFLQKVTGVKDWKPWPEIGAVVDWSEDEAAELIRAGIAELPEANGWANPEAAEPTEAA